MQPSSTTETKNLWIYASDGDVAGVETCLATGQTPNDSDEHGYTPMHAAASYNHVELLTFLVSRGGNVNLQDPDGETPLFVCEEVPTAQALVGMGADISIRNLEGKTAAEVAAEDGHYDVANFLRALDNLPPVNPADYESSEEEFDVDDDDDGQENNNNNNNNNNRNDNAAMDEGGPE